MTRSSMAAVLLLGLIPCAASVRTSMQHVQGAMSDDKAQIWIKDWKTDKVCCCEAMGKDQKCYWQQRIRIDTGSGCNLGGLFNPFADRKRVSGFTDGPRKRFYIFDVRKYGKYGQCLLDQDTCDANEIVYQSKCELLTGRIDLIPDAHGKMHQYIRNDAFFANIPEAAKAPVKKEEPEAGPAVEELVHDVRPDVFVEDVDPVGMEDPDDNDSEEVRAAQQEEVDREMEKVQLTVTNRNIKKCERWSGSGWGADKNQMSKVFCSQMCDMWPPVPTAAVTQKKGCHSMMDAGKFSNAAKYCKNACSPDNGCQTPADQPEPSNPAKPCD